MGKPHWNNDSTSDSSIVLVQWKLIVNLFSRILNWASLLESIYMASISEDCFRWPSLMKWLFEMISFLLAYISLHLHSPISIDKLSTSILCRIETKRILSLCRVSLINDSRNRHSRKALPPVTNDKTWELEKFYCRGFTGNNSKTEQYKSTSFPLLCIHYSYRFQWEVTKVSQLLSPTLAVRRETLHRRVGQ